MNINKYVFTEAWRIYKANLKHGVILNFGCLLKTRYAIAKLLIKNGLTNFYTDPQPL